MVGNVLCSGWGEAVWKIGLGGGTLAEGGGEGGTGRDGKEVTTEDTASE